MDTTAVGEVPRVEDSATGVPRSLAGDRRADAAAVPPPDEATLDPADWDRIRALGHTMLDDMVTMLQTVRQRPVWQPVPAAVRARFDAPLPLEATAPEAVYTEFQRSVQPYPTGNIHPRFWGWVMGTGSVTGVLADMLGAALNGNAIGGDQSSTYLETQVLAWLRQMLRYPADASGILVDGGSVANLVGITAARQARAQLDVDGHGLAGRALRPVLYCSSETHNSVAKAVALLGLGAQGIRRVAVHADHSVDVDALRAAIRTDRTKGYHPFCIVGNAGTVNTGAFDDLHALADVAAAEGLWFHIDGAFGGFAALGASVRHLVSGMERADSLAVDLHKWLHMPYDVGCAFVRDPQAHRASFAQTASYLDPQARGFAAGSQWFAEYGPQLSRGNRALKVWMELKTHGVRRYAELVEQNVGHAQRLAQLVAATPGFELAAPVPLNVVCLRMTIPGASLETINQANKELLLRIQEQGVALPSSTVLAGQYVLRVAITNHRTRAEDLEMFMRTAAEIASALRADHARPDPHVAPALGRAAAPGISERVAVVPYRPDHHAAFRDLNIAWITRYFAVEPRDLRDLGDPDRYILRPGGAIFVAELDGVPVGTCALLHESGGVYELAKMAVAERARGHGVGRALANAVIAHARAMGVGELELFTNSVLEPAIRLYRAVGFVDAPLEHAEYGRANMRMVLRLTPPDAPGAAAS